MNKVFTFTEAKIDSYISMDETEGRRLVDRLAKSFIMSVPTSLDDLDSKLQMMDWEQVGFIAHKLISTCGNLGFSSMMELAIAIETCSTNAESFAKNQMAIRANIQALREHYTQAGEQLRKLKFLAGVA